MEYKISVNDLPWDEKTWEKFCKFARKKHRWLEFTEEKTVNICNKTNFTEYEANIIVRGLLDEFLDKNFPLKRYIPPQISTKKLPITTNVISDTYLFLSLKLAMLQSNEKSCETLDQYFLDIKMNYAPSFWHFYDFDEALMNMVDIRGISYCDIMPGEICGIIRGILEDGQYATIHLDEFYLTEKESFDTLHLVRENLVYGFDDTKKVFLVYGFGKREKMETFEVSYDDFLFSFEKGRRFYFSGAGYLKMEWCYPVTRIVIKDCDRFQLTEKYLLKKMQEFLYPEKSKDVNGEIQIYGSNVYKWIIEELQGISNRETIDYRTFHLLYEHKRNVYRCLGKLKYDELSENTKKYMKEYETVVKKFNRIRIIYMCKAGISTEEIRKNKIHKTYSLGDDFVHKFVHAVNFELEIIKAMLN
ncbi:amino acid adenylation domain protein [Clostridium sp. CAG:277]|jgi:hypothetical protein|nr:amino acid adenylation domain protein [Clostridium sp. CAG:277]